jgi:hypothetical protein
MQIWVKPKLHTHKECGQRFHPLLHISYTVSDSPIRWRCLLRVLCPVRRPVTALDYVLLKDRNLALAPRQGPEINSRVCLWVLPSPHPHIRCWLTNQRLILRRISCLETPKASSGPSNSRTEPSLASSSAISLPHTPACPWTQYSPTANSVEVSSMPFGTVGPMEMLSWWSEELSKQPDYQSRYLGTSLVYTKSEFHKHTQRQHISQPHVCHNQCLKSFLCCLFQDMLGRNKINCTS